MNRRSDRASASGDRVGPETPRTPKVPKAPKAQTAPPAGQGAGAGVRAPPFGASSRQLARSATPASAARQRKLHVGHFAFMRAVVQGLDPRESWERYFRVEGEASDQRTVRATIAWIRDEFALVAKRHDRFGRCV